MIDQIASHIAADGTLAPDLKRNAAWFFTRYSTSAERKWKTQPRMNAKNANLKN